VATLRAFTSEDRGENERAQECAEDGTEQDQRYASASAIGRVHVGRRGSREHYRTHGSPDQEESPDHRHHRKQRSTESGKHATEDSQTEASCKHGNSAEAVHRPSCYESAEGCCDQEDGRADAG
jgi:hypothetical protein